MQKKGVQDYVHVANVFLSWWPLDNSRLRVVETPGIRCNDRCSIQGAFTKYEVSAAVRRIALSKAMMKKMVFTDYLLMSLLQGVI